MVENSENGSKFSLPILVVLALVLVVGLLLLGRFCSSAATIDVTVNETPLTLHGAKTLDTAIRESGLPINPGDFISLKGTVLKRRAGSPFYATVNGEETTDGNRELHNGDVIVLSDGKDIVEDYDATEEELPYDAVVTGAGAICTFEPGRPGVVEHRTGRVSGHETRVVIQDSKNASANWRRPDVGDDMAIALTFDEGPSKYTDQILDVLAENDVQATFFCQGDQVGSHIETVKREWGTYHQVASNTYSHTVNQGTTADDLRQEVDLGFRALAEALGGAEIKRVVRFPDALLTRDMAAEIADDVDAVIGWDVDTGDWLETNSNEVYETLMNVQSGNIVVLHDGGGDCSGTVEALKRALPKLKARGFQFVTIDRLMGYPAKKEG